MNFVTPTGFRDILPEEAAVREEIASKVQGCFAKRGYVPIETPTLEVMDVLQAGGRVPASPFKFFDSQGDLLAMRPDVTLQIARMCATRLKGQDGPFRFRYLQRVFRETEAEMRATARELTQFGIELIGLEGSEADAEMLTLFAEALEAGGIEDYKLVIGTVGVLRALLDLCDQSVSWKEEILAAYHSSNFVELENLLQSSAISPKLARAIQALPRIRGGKEAITALRALVEPLGCAKGIDSFEKTYDLLVDQGLGKCVMIDFSIMSSFDYYTGIVVEAYAAGLGSPLGSGGRYDNMLGSYGQERPAAGFAFYLESLMTARAAVQRQEIAGATKNSRVSENKNSSTGKSERSLRIAIPKGTLNGDTIKALKAAGLDVGGLDNPGRQLIISNPGVDFIIVRPTDAPIFVALGAADCGICGKDSLLEADSDVVELVDLGFGSCRFVVAEPEGSSELSEERYRTLGSIRIATKYPKITQDYYAQEGVQVEIVKLHGNIELAPLIGMAERIVDITATGTTLRENKLTIVDEILSSTARFFANACAFRTDGRIMSLVEALEGQKED